MLKNTPTSTVMTQPLKPKKSGVLINFIAGGIGGTAGVFVTCPLDVVQTRLQSTVVQLPKDASIFSPLKSPKSSLPGQYGLRIFLYMRHVIKTEGFFALYKGMIPNLIGIAPSRAMYFAVYSKTKGFLESTRLSNSSWTHMLSALSASWTVSTVTNPIWFMKTKLQLNTSQQRKPVSQVVKEVFRSEGIRGFYRGLTASYAGASETMIYFVIYEKLKSMLEEQNLTKLNPVNVIAASFTAKMIAIVSVYPHEVVRTRLRQESMTSFDNRVYRGFFQTLLKVFREERWRGVYGGMGAHLMRQVPNTVIMFATYESIVNFFSD